MSGASKERVAIGGATGLVGEALVRALVDAGHDVVRLVRSDTQPVAGARDVVWHPAAGELDPAALADVDVVVNLSGENLAQRWTDDVKRRIRQSRLDATRLLAERVAQLTSDGRGPRTMISASAVGIYGDRGDERLDESSATGDDFLAGVAKDWERATEPASRAGVRVVTTRFGIILSDRGGALAKMLPPFRLGVGGTIGSGKQWMSWVALADVVSAIRFAIGDTSLIGPVNLTAPNPVTNAEFTAALGRALHRPTLARVPGFALRMVYGEMADEALLSGQRVLPRRLTESGFVFRYPTLDEALVAVLR